MKRKWLAVGIILLFIGVAVAPSINFNVVKASDDNDLIEVTTQACGISGFEDHTMKLTQQQYETLKQYLVNFRVRLNAMTSREDAVPIFKEAVVELNKYGLLPKGMSVEQAQKVIFHGYLNQQGMSLLQKINQRNQKASSNESNNFCLVAGSTNQTVFTGVLFTSLYSTAFLTSLLGASFDNLGFLFLALLANAIDITCWILAYFLLLLSSTLTSPLPIGGIAMFGKRVSHGEGPNLYYPSQGWVWTRGLNGQKKWNGSFVGDVYFFNGIEEKYYMGAIGFSGFTMKRISNGEVLFLGTALRITVDTEPPYP